MFFCISFNYCRSNRPDICIKLKRTLTDKEFNLLYSLCEENSEFFTNSIPCTFNRCYLSDKCTSRTISKEMLKILRDAYARRIAAM